MRGWGGWRGVRVCVGAVGAAFLAPLGFGVRPRYRGCVSPFLPSWCSPPLPPFFLGSGKGAQTPRRPTPPLHTTLLPTAPVIRWWPTAMRVCIGTGQTVRGEGRGRTFCVMGSAAHAPGRGRRKYTRCLIGSGHESEEEKTHRQRTRALAGEAPRRVTTQCSECLDLVRAATTAPGIPAPFCADGDTPATARRSQSAPALASVPSSP